MRKNVLISSLLGGVVGFVWLFVSNAMIPIKSRMIHQVAPNQKELHAVLKESIREPGTYLIPLLRRDQQASFADYESQPVYSVIYSGYTHGQPGSAGDIAIPIVLVFVVATLASCLLSATSAKVVSSYSRRVVFVTLVGVLIALHDDVLQMFFGPQPRDYLAYLAINNVLTWFWMGLAIAWKARPVEAS